ncbi:aspartate/glutamate racemase family protein [Streptomyces megasporus]|uniref:aspartate/glutamate racemase family protein n=1 Tax=Streptomyces megasporus TaxID=44060 RepID=UPI001FDEAB69|nr:amino acid racemase [Streptomyces megasporus]
MTPADRGPVAVETGATGVPRTLGVLGGMGPAATAEFLRLLALRTPAGNDQQHPRIVMLSDPGIPERTGAVLAGSDEPLPAIRRGLVQLADWGADLLAVPCNTAHVFIDRIQADIPVPLVHIVDATLRAAMRVNPSGGWLAATTGTVRSGLYQWRAAACGYRLLLPDEATQDRIHRAGILVKANETDRAGEVLGAAARELWRERDLPVLTACTELPIAYAAAGLPEERSVSSLAALAEECVARLLAHRPPAAGGARNREIRA